ncbi:MAG: hypothetical protein ABIH89_03120 [Elusimicrobiota bacterium]
MRYDKFRTKYKNVPIITTQLLKLSGDYGHALRIQILRWQKTGKIVKLRRNLYILNQEDREIDASLQYISRELYSPSYISLEYAMSEYSLIEEIVTDITCISTKKTIVCRNRLGRFVYKHVMKNCFTGFIEKQDTAGLTYLMASPEKAVVDYLYLNQSRFNGDYRKTLTETMGIRNTRILDKEKLNVYAGLFSSAKLVKLTEALMEIHT